MYQDGFAIINAAIKATAPDAAVKKALVGKNFGNGKLILVAIGKAAWAMAQAAYAVLGSRINKGIVITKYGHSMGNIPNVQIFEAGHPIADKNSFEATEKVLQLVKNLDTNDHVLFLVSGGGSALFEQTLIDPIEHKAINKQLLASGASIVEINTIRKRLSKVKGGKFAKLCEPAQIFSIVLSDIIGDPLHMIASGPAYPDASTTAQAISIIKKYKLLMSEKTKKIIENQKPFTISNVKTMITGSVTELCLAAQKKAKELGYEALILTTSLSCQAREAGDFLGSIAQYYKDSKKNRIFIAGGETIVRLQGTGMGGRNQELVLAAAKKIEGISNCVIFSCGSDGTDGPTDAAGGFVDGNTVRNLKQKNIDIDSILANNDSYTALEAIDHLIITGPTGTNVNDISFVLIGKD